VGGVSGREFLLPDSKPKSIATHRRQLDRPRAYKTRDDPRLLKEAGIAEEYPRH